MRQSFSPGLYQELTYLRSRCFVIVYAYVTPRRAVISYRGRRCRGHSGYRASYRRTDSIDGKSLGSGMGRPSQTLDSVWTFGMHKPQVGSAWRVDREKSQIGRETGDVMWTIACSVYMSRKTKTREEKGQGVDEKQL